ncbi:hypothetical protein RGE_11930 [Rubrivivax gelatinosus IL144]|uniref:Uncharacterized protein n=1 Tax=Rubrivivax gelatinosus (strain NBRC 100245 / IL144) TaxID=983917 RepID=I0HNE7_RUBGI|nr:hypothetical protein RGE_11930 [Rubrivivax gelatinosus IL144]
MKDAQGAEFGRRAAGGRPAPHEGPGYWPGAACKGHSLAAVAITGAAWS